MSSDLERRIVRIEQRLNASPFVVSGPKGASPLAGIQIGMPLPATQDEVDAGNTGGPFIGLDSRSGDVVAETAESTQTLVSSGTAGVGRAFLGWSVILTSVAAIVKNSTAFLAITNPGQSATESDRDFYLPSACRLQNFRVYMETNDTGTNDNTVTIRDAGVSTALTVTYDSGETGLKEELTSTHDMAAGGIITVEVVNTATSGGGVKNLGVRAISIECVML